MGEVKNTFERWVADLQLSGAFLILDEHSDTIVATVDAPTDREAAAADARLLAAAPELRSALNNAAEFISFYFVQAEAERNREVEGLKNMVAEAVTALDVARAALAKARGE